MTHIQNPKDPNFKCKLCEDFHAAPAHRIIYSCPVHGPLCKRSHSDLGRPGECTKNLIIFWWSADSSSWTEPVEVKKDHQLIGNSIVDILLEGQSGPGRITLVKLLSDRIKLSLQEAKALVDSSPALLKKGIREEEAIDLIAGFADLGARIFFIRESKAAPDKPGSAASSTEKAAIHALIDSFEEGKIQKENFIMILRSLVR